VARAADVVRFLKLCRRFGAAGNMPNVRDRSMAENIAWILDHHGPGAKIVVWAHNGHVSHNPAEPGTGSMGSELERRFGDDHVVFGFSFDRGSFQAIYRSPTGVADGKPGLRPFTVGPAQPGSVDRLLARAGIRRFVIDLREAPSEGPVADWLAAPHPMRSIGAIFAEETERQFYTRTILPDHYDAVIFMDSTTRARPNRLTREKFAMPPP